MTASAQSNIRRPPSPDDPGDGDAQTFCSTCAFGSVCLNNGLDKVSLNELHCLIEHIGPFHTGDHIFRMHDPFAAVYAVRAGMIKTYMVDEQGREQVLGFHLPGELVGLNAIYPSRYPCNAVCLDTTTICRFSFPAMATLATKIPGLQEQLFKLMSKDIGASAFLTGDYSADERLAAFLLSLSQRNAERGYSNKRLHLLMPRADIANYLRLATETVSRVLRRFQDQGVITVDRREVEVLNLPKLESLARGAI